jgi:anaerobic selenocysteine-containing dehydrogenase
LAAVDQPLATVEFLAGLIADSQPMHIWCGFGLQRHIHGGLTIRLIDALSMLTCNIGLPGGGVNFADTGMWDFPQPIIGRRPDTRFININNFAHELQQLSDPPVKFLWVACRDPLRQDMALRDLRAAWQDLELVVTADKFMTKTAQMSDIFLPVTTEFESLDVFGGYFRHFLGINEPAIPPTW